MSFKYVLAISALGICSTVTWSSASATSYVAQGESFSGMSSVSQADVATHDSFEFFTRDTKLGIRQPMSGRPTADNVPDSQASGAGIFSADTALMLLISGGLVALQLRRKQKSLPHQTLTALVAD